MAMGLKANANPLGVNAGDAAAAAAPAVSIAASKPDEVSSATAGIAICKGKRAAASAREAALVGVGLEAWHLDKKKGRHGEN